MPCDGNGRDTQNFVDFMLLDSSGRKLFWFMTTDIKVLGPRHNRNFFYSIETCPSTHDLCDCRLFSGTRKFCLCFAQHNRHPRPAQQSFRATDRPPFFGSSLHNKRWKIILIQTRTPTFLFAKGSGYWFSRWLAPDGCLIQETNFKFCSKLVLENSTRRLVFMV